MCGEIAPDTLNVEGMKGIFIWQKMDKSGDCVGIKTNPLLDKA